MLFWSNAFGSVWLEIVNGAGIPEAPESSEMTSSDEKRHRPNTFFTGDSERRSWSFGGRVLQGFRIAGEHGHLGTFDQAALRDSSR